MLNDLSCKLKVLVSNGISGRSSTRFAVKNLYISLQSLYFLQILHRAVQSMVDGLAHNQPVEGSSPFGATINIPNNSIIMQGS